MIIKLKYIFTHKTFLILLFIINLFGTIYGYLWYAGQLAITPAVFIPFVPDSPTATLFFTIFLIFFLFFQNVSYIDALSVIWLFMYVIWVVELYIFTFLVN